MEIIRYTSGAIFIDDQKEEVSNAIQFFQKNGLNVKYINPNELTDEEVISFYGFRIVFIDLVYMLGTVDITRAVNLLRRISDNGIKHLIVVAWTEHEEYMNELKETIEEKMVDSLPLILLNAKKSDFLEITDINEFDEKMDSLFEETIDSNKTLFKLLEWEKSSFSSVHDMFNNIINKAYNGEISTMNLDRALGLYSEQTLSPKSIISSFDIMNKEISNNTIKKIYALEDLILNYDSSSITDVEKLKYNYTQIVDFKLIEKITGSIYKNSSLKVDDYNPDSCDNTESVIIKRFKESGMDCQEVFDVKIDITPNCISCRKAKKNRIMIDGLLIKGVVLKNNNYEKTLKAIKEIFKAENYHQECFINDNNEMYCLVANYLHCQTINIDSYEKVIMCQLKNEFKMVLQQEFGSFISKIGDNIYHE